MPDTNLETFVVTDIEELEITIIEHANVQFISVTAPDCVEANEDFVITYQVQNNGPEDMCGGRIVDSPTGAEIAGSKWQEIIPSNGSVIKNVTISGSDVMFALRIEVGYVK